MSSLAFFMNTVSLKGLLEAGSHFGHKKERWHPKAQVFIYGEKEGVHIIDLAKTKTHLEEAGKYVGNLAREGKTLLMIGTKRQARGVVSEAARSANAFYMTNRWVGGYITNFEEVKKNVDKLNRMEKESADGTWNKFPKHERVKLEKEMRKLNSVYGGVALLDRLPDAVFIVDIRKEYNAVQEAKRRNIPIVAIVDTNSNPTLVDYYIPANDDAVGSIKYISDYIASSFGEGKKLGEKTGKEKETVVKTAVKAEEEKKVEKKEKQKVLRPAQDKGKKVEIAAEKTKTSEQINVVSEEKVNLVEKPKKKVKKQK